jgi:hypothetical protein
MREPAGSGVFITLKYRRANSITVTAAVRVAGRMANLAGALHRSRFSV